MRAALKLAADALLAVLLAPACAACKAPLEHPASGAICEECWSAIDPISPPVCRSCGDPLPPIPMPDALPGRCARCRRRPPAISHTRSLGVYDGALRAIVHALKYDGRRTIAHQLGMLLRASTAEVLAGADACVPVPLHRSRQRARGFNQAADLARHIGLPVACALKRVRRTATQADLPEARRHANVHGAFRLARGADVRGLVIVLVDDVSTTGATLEACARVLVEAGAREVRAVTAAKAVSRRP